MCLFIARFPEDLTEKNLRAGSFLTSLTWANGLGNAFFRHRLYWPVKYITALENLPSSLRLLLRGHECHCHIKHLTKSWKNESTLFYQRIAKVRTASRFSFWDVVIQNSSMNQWSLALLGEPQVQGKRGFGSPGRCWRSEAGVFCHPLSWQPLPFAFQEVRSTNVP